MKKRRYVNINKAKAYRIKCPYRFLYKKERHEFYKLILDAMELLALLELERIQEQKEYIKAVALGIGRL